MYYSVCLMVHVEDPLLLIGKNSKGSRNFPNLILFCLVLFVIFNFCLFCVVFLWCFFLFFTFHKTSGFKHSLAVLSISL